MNHAKRRVRKAMIGVESMEGRVVLSTVQAMVLPTQGSLVRGVHYLFLQGSAQGSVSRAVGNPDAGNAANVTGTARIASLGKVQLTGSFHGTGFIASGSVSGTIKLSNGKGSVTLLLQGPTVGGSTAPTSGTYQYSVQSGTGALSHETGSGSVDVVLGPKTFMMKFHGRPNNA